MTLLATATIVCDECTEVVSFDGFKAMFANDAVADLGWLRDTEGRHWCPPCAAERRSKK